MTWTKVIALAVALWIGLGVLSVVLWASNDRGYSGPTVTVEK